MSKSTYKKMLDRSGPAPGSGAATSEDCGLKLGDTVSIYRPRFRGDAYSWQGFEVTRLMGDTCILRSLDLKVEIPHANVATVVELRRLQALARDEHQNKNAVGISAGGDNR